jgi:hypothetical protein
VHVDIWSDCADATSAIAMSIIADFISRVLTARDFVGNETVMRHLIEMRVD